MARFFLVDLLAYDTSIKKALGVTVFFIIVQWVFMGVYGWQLPPEIPLFYSLPMGAAQLAPRAWYFFLPVSTLGFTLLNLLLFKWGMLAVRIYIPLMGWLMALYAFLSSLAMFNIARLTL